MTPATLRIIDRYEDGQDALHFRFEGDAALRAQPGQFFMLSVPGVGEAPFTYVSLPDGDGRFDALVRRVGSLTGELFGCDGERVLGHRGPLGRGWPAAREGERTLVVAGGCGLAPLAAAIDSLGEHALLVYGSRTRDAQVLSKERSSWHDRIEVLETFDRPQAAGDFHGTPVQRLDEAIEALGGVDRALLCGPEVMMDATAAALQQRGLAAHKIWASLERRMHCGIGLCGHCYIGHTYACTDGPTYRWDALSRLRATSPTRPALVTDIHHC